ncbi:MarR family winged helix-turn-helix transcriptional regulator [Devriesea agamarum]|uniref:MarR family winged helix-turn-helix transcriptional regulator n=1 Tax=Devriesea agamarum TaxID=472569 RepID=UPI00071CB4B1|nr:MarR family transcriptional regulator [Devriesea agamarum]
MSSSASGPDEVDRIMAAWRAVRPDLDVEPLAVLSRLSRLAHHLENARRGAFTATGIEAWEFDVLSALRRAGAPYELSPGELVKQTLVTSGTMTNRIDKLVTKGLVTRRPHPGDGRGVRVRLADAGIEVVDTAMARLLDSEHDLLAPLDARKQAGLAATLRSLLLSFER